MLLDVAIISVIIALLRGGKLNRLANIDLKRIDFILAAFLIQFMLVFLGSRGYGFLASWGPALHILSYLLLLVAMCCNLHIPALWLVSLGILLNFIVIVANNGSMPVSVASLTRAGLDDFLPTLKSDSYVIHKVLTSETRLKFLADVIALPPPYPRPRVINLGDIIMALGAFLLLQSVMLKKKA